tara:strand:+ start:265 stop:831 length:567 start_codon:yes stop_codon:yes gene_type:complete
MKLDHLIWPTIGWGYLPNSEPVFDIFRTVNQDIQPKSILEIGFHAGHSTTYMLELMPQADVSTVGIINARSFNRSIIVQTMKNIYQDRFDCYLGNPPDVLQLFQGRSFDLAFIDGNHTYADVTKDIQSCMKLKIPYLLLDNCEKKTVARSCDEQLGIYKYKNFCYNSTWNNKTQINEMRLYNVQYNDI